MQTFTPTPEQQKIVDVFKRFLTDKTKQIFILKGSAGSGKTSMIMFLVQILEQYNLHYKVIAPTGRAAKVIKKKFDAIGLDIKSSTIHSAIYSFDKIESLEVECDDITQKSFCYYFPIKKINDSYCLIVDEASMVGDSDHHQEYMRFGSGQLLTDLLHYAQFASAFERKIVFVGDPAQLPPVGEHSSLALSKEYFLSKGFGVVECQLETVIRQAENSGILRAAMHIREQIQSPLIERASLKIETCHDVVSLSENELINKYIELYPTPNLAASVIVSWSNERCLRYNQNIRHRYYGSAYSTIQIGDLLLVNQNNHIFGFSNGDIVRTISTSSILETRVIPVYIRGIKKHVELCFREMEVQSLSTDNTVKVLILETLLQTSQRDLSIAEQRALYIDFCIRFRDKYPLLREDGQEFQEMLGQDIYFNALRVKYGYSITCHKAQGGEWDTVFVDYSGRTGIDDDSLRWSYTATTRAKNILYGVHLPTFSRMEAISIRPIEVLSKITIPSHQYELIEADSFISPYHKQSAHIALRMHYHQVASLLRDTPFSINSVSSLQYCERYVISCGAFWSTELDFVYNAQYQFTFPTIRDSSELGIELLRLFDQGLPQLVELSYQPSTPLLEEFYQHIMIASQASGMCLVNVEERLTSYYVLYLFLTSFGYAELQCYFSKKKGVTSITPRSSIGARDEKLKSLLFHLENITDN